MAKVPKYLVEERDRLIDQMSRLYEQAEAARNKLEGLELAIELMEKGERQDGEAPEPKAATNIKTLLLDLAREVKAEGLNANIAVKLAAKRGIALKRGTAASNLSRLKTDNALVHDGERYRLPEFVRPKSSGNLSAAGVATNPFTVVGAGAATNLTMQELVEHMGVGQRAKHS